MSGSTPGILCDADPRAWRSHRFGLPEARWASLAGQAFWITGAGTGFGRALAIALAVADAKVFISGRRLRKLTETISDATALGARDDRIVAVPCDVTRPELVGAAAAQIAGQTRHLLGLVNNAALPSPPSGAQALLRTTPEQWERLLSTNVTGPWLIAGAALPHMLAGGAVRMLFVTSEAGWAFTPGVGPYNVSKAALNNLGASFAEECAAANPQADVQVNVLVPGEAATEMNRGSAISPFALVSMALVLLSHPPGGPNGRFFHRDGRHLSFGYAAAYGRSLLDGSPMPVAQAALCGDTIPKARGLLAVLRRFAN
jgi:NAD(P)-dependent dehydrogenase (short-subunit alcohol dehydrogenase family)